VGKKEGGVAFEELVRLGPQSASPRSESRDEHGDSDQHSYN
jgi:hypothetical protein